VIAVERVRGVGDGKKVARKRATGTREHVVAFLTESGELYDKDGLASTRLAEAVGYPGSSVAFAQLLSGMERSGLIVREVHGKRTYRIALGDVEGFGPVSRAPARDAEPVGGAGFGSGVPGYGFPGFSGSGFGSGSGAGSGSGDFDYDELARRLLVQVVRRLAAASASSAASASATSSASTASFASAAQEPVVAANNAVAELEHELANAWSKHSKLAEENIRLREQLRAAQRSLAQARDQFRRLPVTSDLDNAEVVLLQRLLQQD
jgi:hypothetical protein